MTVYINDVNIRKKIIAYSQLFDVPISSHIFKDTFDKNKKTYSIEFEDKYADELNEIVKGNCDFKKSYSTHLQEHAKKENIITW